MVATTFNKQKTYTVFIRIDTPARSLKFSEGPGLCRKGYRRIRPLANSAPANSAPTNSALMALATSSAPKFNKFGPQVKQIRPPLYFRNWTIYYDLLHFVDLENIRDTLTCLKRHYEV